MADAPGRQLAALGEVLRAFDREGIEAWLFGGWAVDFHLGRVTREHADLDLAVWQADLQRIAMLLEVAGWVHAPEAGEDGYTGYERGDVRLELAFLVRVEGGLIFTPTSTGFASWADGAFGDEAGELEGVRARVISRAALREEKAGPRSDPRAAAKDRADIAALDG